MTIDDENELLNTIGDALADISLAYVRDADGNLLPTTVITSPSGEVVAKWERGTKTAAEVDALVRQFVELSDLPEPPESKRGPGRPEIGPMINVRMPPAMIERLDVEAHAAGESRAETIRRLLSVAMTTIHAD